MPGIGFGTFKIGKTTFGQVINNFGNNYSIDTFYVKSFSDLFSEDTISLTTQKKDIYSYRLYYASLGVSFFKYKDSKKIFSIYFQNPALAITDLGIKLNVDNFNEVIKKYGQTNWSYTTHKIFKEYNGIRFEQYSNNKIPLITDKDTSFYLTKPITGISILKKKRRHSH